MYRNRARFPDWLYTHTLQQKGTWAFSVPGATPYIVISSPANLEHVLKRQFHKYEKGPTFQTHFRALLGNGIFNTDGENWKHQRTMALQQFRRRELRQHISTVMVERSHAVIDLLEGHAQSKQTFDLQRIFYAYTLDTFSEIAFGHHLDSLHTDSSFAEAFDRSQWLINRRFTTPWWKLERAVNVGAERVLKGSISHLKTYVRVLVKERLSMPTSELADKNDLLSASTCQLADADAQAPPNRDSAEQQLIDLVLNFMIAGRDTTAGALSWTFYRLWKHPELQAKVVEEIDRVIGDAPFAFTHTGSLPYTRAFFFETLRLHPSVSKTLKYANQDDTLPDGTSIPSGCGVVYSPYTMGRLEELWGPEALEFDPERWLSTNKKGQRVFHERTPYHFPQFNAGPRICLGKHMAVMEAEILIASVLRRFRFNLAMDEDQVVYLDSLTAPVDGGLMMKVECA
jgi:cytochrome P450